MNNLCSAPLSTNQKTSHYPSLDSINVEVNSTRWLTSVLILVPLRLGLHELDIIYEDHLKEALKLPQTVGIIGGSPRRAVYILGYQDESFIDLDPHFIQTTVNVLGQTFDISVRMRERESRKNELGEFCRVMHVHHQKNLQQERWIQVVH